MPPVTVGEAVAVLNQTLEYAYPTIEIVGEVSSFTINQSKFVFFDIKDNEAALPCFMMKFQLRTALEDGMKVKIAGTPKVTAKGKFSVTVRTVTPMGQGAIKRSFELLKASLEKEGLFDASRKRTIPDIPQKIAVISSTQAAGYNDFITLIDKRWGGLKIDVAHVQVQGEAASGQIIRALNAFNQAGIQYDAIILLRGGGGVDDLAVFNDEKLVRAVAASRIPTVSAIGHEQDIVLTDFVCDMRASTPSHAAQLLVPDRRQYIETLHRSVRLGADSAVRHIDTLHAHLGDEKNRLLARIESRYATIYNDFTAHLKVVRAVNPRHVLRQGYAIVRGRSVVGETISVVRKNSIITAEVKHVETTNEY